jgi:hypothetical protein
MLEPRRAKAAQQKKYSAPDQRNVHITFEIAFSDPGGFDGANMGQHHYRLRRTFQALCRSRFRRM